ncbi:nadph-dependent fmn reductase [Lucifera butyrica]|uniref:Nadph-dependent fmn reductase n=1 Tax=Lucifera butyrica TaxID=1351585 RepID=A0A498RB04_9FIRM|nr:flavodoxin family protein [Lucifera butyrica]VBB07452.1 nadph-dependent fmn reductase [Lucifera butyrica]
MKILGLVASPRKLGNSEILVREMFAALPDDTEKEMIRLTELDIKPCKACYACLPGGRECVIQDDLAFLLSKIKAADGVIIASACYFLGCHTSLKRIGDRLISVLAEAPQYAGKRCVTAVTYGIAGWEGYAREMVNNFARFLHLEIVGDMTVRAANPGEAVRPEVLSRAGELAQALLSAGENSGCAGSDWPDSLLCPSCGSSLLRLAPSGAVRCVMCGATGRIAPAGTEYAIQFQPPQPARYSPAGMEEHSRLLAQIKQDYLANRSRLFGVRKAYEKPDWWVKPEE